MGKKAELYEFVPEGDEVKLRLNFHAGQWRGWESEARFTFLLAGTQGGKTSYGPWWLFREIYGLGDFQGRGPGDYLAVTASYDLFKLKMLPSLLNVFRDVWRVGRWWAGDKIIELQDPDTGKFWASRSDDPMWGRIILRSAAAGGGLESSTALGAWLDECGQDDFTLETWEAVLRRLSLAEGRVLGTTTLYNRGWLKNEVFDLWRDGDPDYNVIQFPSFINPLFPRREYLRAKRRLPPWRFNMFYRGLFANPPGLIYGDFTDAVLVDDFPIPPHWRRVVGIDFGGANLALIWLAQDPATAVWYAYHEELKGGLSTPEYVGGARARLAAEGVQQYDFAGGAGSEGQERRDWSAAGLHVWEPTFDAVEAGIGRVIGLLRTGRLRCFRSLRGLRDEFGSYSRKVDDQGEVLEDILDKRKFHRLDGLRYAAVFIEAGAKDGEAGYLF